LRGAKERHQRAVREAVSRYVNGPTKAEALAARLAKAETLWEKIVIWLRG